MMSIKVWRGRASAGDRVHGRGRGSQAGLTFPWRAVASRRGSVGDSARCRCCWGRSARSRPKKAAASGRRRVTATRRARSGPCWTRAVLGVGTARGPAGHFRAIPMQHHASSRLSSPQGRIKQACLVRTLARSAHGARQARDTQQCKDLQDRTRGNEKTTVSTTDGWASTRRPGSRRHRWPATASAMAPSQHP